MKKFLHIADTHLGKKLYQSEDRTFDFFLSLRSVIETYALKPKIDFLLIAGDFFDVRNIDSTTMNQAVECLQLLQDAKIPVLMSEGNHDSVDKNSKTSWLHSLCKWGLLKLLEPEFDVSGNVVLTEWNENTNSGSYIDIENIRVYGNVWMGSSTSEMIFKIADSLEKLHDPNRYNIMMLHADIEGQLEAYIKGVPIKKLDQLKPYIDYLALGHIHKNFEIDGWIYNPGGLENATVDECKNVKGAYLVKITGKKHKASLLQDYRKRPVTRLMFELNKDLTPEEFQKELEVFLQSRVEKYQPESEKLAPIIEITFTGVIGFKTSLLNLNKIRDSVKKEYNPLLVLIKNKTIPVDIPAEIVENMSRKDIEKRVFTELINKDSRFKDRSDKMSDLIIEAKRLALSGESGERIAQMIENNISKEKE